MITATAQTAEIEHLARRFEATKPEAILEWAVERFRPMLAMTSSLGAEGIVLIDKLAHRTRNQKCWGQQYGQNAFLPLLLPLPSQTNPST